MFLIQARLILLNTLPVLVSQLASMGTTIIDTVLLGHFNTEDLAAVAVGGGIYIAIVLALAGVLQAVAPMVAHLKGAEKTEAIAGVLQQGFWLSLALSAIGILALRHPDALLALSSIEPAVEAKARLYLDLLSWGVPAVLIYRTFYAFCVALGKPRPLMFISLAATALHGVFAWALVNGHFSIDAWMGVAGCGVSGSAVAWFSVFCGLIYLCRAQAMRPYRLFESWQLPRAAALRELLRLGVPMGFSYFIEISCFTLVALFVAQLGASVVAGHRVVSNIAGLIYMLPLSIAIATVAQVGQAVGARDTARARHAAGAGVGIACLLSTFSGLLLWFSAEPLVAAYTGDPTVRRIALSLIPFVVLYQCVDAVQTVAAFALRGYKIAFVPMLAHLVCFWGVGLFGGWWLAFRASAPMGVTGFWIASLCSLMLAAALLGGLLWRVVREERRRALTPQPAAP